MYVVYEGQWRHYVARLMYACSVGSASLHATAIVVAAATRQEGYDITGKALLLWLPLAAKRRLHYLE